MVRLFVPVGEGEHPISPKFIDDDDPHTPLSSCFISSMIMAGCWTGLRRLIGKNNPGSFMRTVVVIAPLLTTVDVAQWHGRQRLLVKAMRKDGVEPTPSRYWSKSNGSSMRNDTLPLLGGVLGLLIALNTRGVPGAVRWQKCIGVGIIGFAAGSVVAGVNFMEPFSKVNSRLAQEKSKIFKSLNADETFKETLTSWERFVLRVEARQTDPRVISSTSTSTRPTDGSIKTLQTADPASDDSKILVRNPTVPQVIRLDELQKYIEKLERLKQLQDEQCACARMILDQKIDTVSATAENDELKSAIVRHQIRHLHTLCEDMQLQGKAIDTVLQDQQHVLASAKAKTGNAGIASESDHTALVPASIPYSAMEDVRKYLAIFDEAGLLPEKSDAFTTRASVPFGLIALIQTRVAAMEVAKHVLENVKGSAKNEGVGEPIVVFSWWDTGIDHKGLEEQMWILRQLLAELMPHLEKMHPNMQLHKKFL